jgi:hypothetical protein
MADSIREQAIKALLARLNDSPPSGVPATGRSRMAATEVASLPTSDLFPSSDDESEVESGFQTSPLNQHEMELTLEIRAKGTDAVSADEATDPILQWVDARVNGYVLANVIRKCRIRRTEWEQELEEHAYVLVTISLTVQFQSLQGDATAWS